MIGLWDYDEKELKKTAAGRRKILERQINYGPGKAKISLSDVKRDWKNLELFSKYKRLFELLIWNK